MTAWTADRPIVKCTDVRKSYGPFEVLKGISFSVRKGEVICIIGPSGSGKSTLIRCINALVPITSGTIHVEGMDVTHAKLDKLALRRKVGMVFQQYNLFPHKTALENVMMAPIHVLRQERKAVEERSRDLLAKSPTTSTLPIMVSLLSTDRRRPSSPRRATSARSASCLRCFDAEGVGPRHPARTQSTKWTSMSRLA